MNYGQIIRALDAVLDLSSAEMKFDETPVRICIDGDYYKEIVAVYPEDINGRLVVVMEAGR